MRRLRARWMLPSDGSSIPSSTRRRVVFPIPLDPTRAIRACWGMLKLSPAKISTGPYDFPMFVAVIKDIGNSIPW